jgi:CubicO group peptidase (beta-lactamase class C family)
VLALALLASGSCGDSPTGPVGALEEGRAGRWPTASPVSVGLDPAALEDFEAAVAAGEAGTLSSTLVLRGGVLVYERYWGDWTADDTHPVNSVTKSVTSLLVGIARDEGHIGDLDTSVWDLLPAYDALAWPDGRAELSLENVLTMRTGLTWDELSTDYRDAANPTADLVASSDWIRYVLALPQSEPPGSSFVYNSGVSMLMGAALGTWTGRSAEAYAARKLFGPLGIEAWGWSEGPGGLTNTGWGLRLRPRDMAAIGQLVLQGGVWEGETVVPSVWIDASRVPATRFEDGTGYGYQWWLPRPDGGVRPMAAWGYGGQYIVVIPLLDIVVVTTAENFGAPGWSPYRFAELAYRLVGLPAPR